MYKGNVNNERSGVEAAKAAPIKHKDKLIKADENRSKKDHINIVFIGHVGGIA